MIVGYEKVLEKCEGRVAVVGGGMGGLGESSGMDGKSGKNGKETNGVSKGKRKVVDDGDGEEHLPVRNGTPKKRKVVVSDDE